MRNKKLYLKVLLFTWAFLPLINLIFLISTENLGVNPQEFIQRYLGTCTLVLLLVTYSISLRLPLIIPDLVSCRRMMGLFSFAYMTCHFLSYLAFEHSFLMEEFFDDFYRRPFVFLGTIAYVITIPLALTSNKVSMKILGNQWKKLHSTIALIILFSIAHYFFHKAGKNDFFWPLIASVVFVVLFILKNLRYPKVNRKVSSMYGRGERI